MDLDPLTNQECGEGTKLCFDPTEMADRCVSKAQWQFSCGLDTCSACYFPNAATYRCSNAGNCQVNTCENGYRNCNNLDPDGCEIYSDFDANNCDECGFKCQLPHVETQACVNGACRVSGPNACVDGWADCDERADTGCECDLSMNTCTAGDCIPTTP